MGLTVPSGLLYGIATVHLFIFIYFTLQSWKLYKEWQSKGRSASLAFLGLYGTLTLERIELTISGYLLAGRGLVSASEGLILWITFRFASEVLVAAAIVALQLFMVHRNKQKRVE